uniref:Uncharacterized protein n=1 Tax=Trichogramma kaykai TaxID=54128 RepID=A0ABD2W0R5_9HYME
MAGAEANGRKKKGNTNASFGLRPHPIIYRRSSNSSSKSSRNSSIVPIFARYVRRDDKVNWMAKWNEVNSSANTSVCRDLRRCAYYDNYKATSFILCLYTHGDTRRCKIIWERRVDDRDYYPCIRRRIYPREE